MTRGGRSFLLVGLALSLVLCQLPKQPRAQARLPNQRRAGTVRYRKVLVPQSEITQLAHGYMPMKRDEFHTLLKRLQEGSKESAPRTTRIESAWYYASAQGDVLTNGIALLNIVHTDGGLAQLRLGPSRLGLGPARWRNSQQPATTGIDASGRFVVLVQQSGALFFPWTLRGLPSTRQNTHFVLTLPETPRAYVVLDLPTDNMLTAEQGLVIRFDQPKKQSSQMGIPSLPNAIPPLAKGRGRWLIQSGGISRIQLNVTPGNATGRGQQPLELQQSTTYHLAEDGLGIQIDLRIGASRPAVSTLVFESDSEIEVTSVRVGGIPVPWTSLSDNGRSVRHVSVYLTSPIDNDTTSLQIIGVAPLRTDSPWKLPGIRLNASFWRQATTTIRVTESLELCQLAPINAFPIRVEPSSDNAAEQLRTFQLLAPDGTLQVVVRRRSTRVAATIDTVIGVSSGTLTAKTVGDLRCEFGRRFAIDATIPVPWTIDGIETEPANAIEDYRFIGRSSGAKHLQIRLARPLTPERSIRLIIRSHRVSGSLLRADGFRPFQLVGVASASYRVAIVPDRAYRLALSGDADLVQLDPREIGADDARQSQQFSGSLAFIDDARADLLQIKVTRENPAFSALIHVDTEVSSNQLTESYRIVCRPDSVPVTRLLIHLSESRESELRWTLDRPDGSILRARQLDENEPLRSPSSNSGETWEIVLRKAQAEPFTIQGRRETRMTDAMPVSLPALPAATSQEAWLTVRSTEGNPLSIEAHSVRATPPKPVPAGRVRTVLARYRYDPSQKARVTLNHVKRLEGRSPVWAWQASLVSRYDRRGHTIHHMIYQIENTGRSNFELRIPNGFTMRRIEIDGTMAADSNRPGKDHEYTIPLQAQKRFARVEVVYQAKGPAPGIVAHLQPAFPVTKIPVLNRRWTVWIPSGFQTMRGDPRVCPTIRDTIDWKHRLLGPLAGQTPFHPFSATDWQSLVTDTDGAAIAPAHLFLQRLGKSLRKLKTDSTSSTWRTLLLQYTGQLDQSGGADPATLWIDASSLADVGFSVDQVLPVTDAEVPLQMANGVISRSNLVVVAQGRTLLLTSRVGLARYFPSLQPTNTRAVVTATAGSELARQLAQLPEHQQPGLLPVRAWISEPAVPASPWRTARGSLNRRLAGESTRICDVLLQPNGTYSLAIYQPAAFRAMGLGALLLAAGIAILLVRHVPSVAGPILVTLSVIAMLVPGFLVPISSGVFLGMLIAVAGMLVARVLAARRRPPARQCGSTATMITAGATGAAILLFFLAIATRTTAAQEPDEVVSEEPIYRVLVPVNERREPVGQYDYLPMQFYETIHRSGAKGSQAEREPLIRSAFYHAVFNWRHQRSALNLTSLIARYQLEVFLPNQWVAFPWSSDVQQIEILEARIGGKPAELVWNSDRTTFSVLVSSPGIAELELVLRAAIGETQTSRELDFPIPRIPQSILRIEAPADAVGIKVPSALGTFFLDIDSGAIEYQLGPAESLQVDWPAESSVAETSPMEIEQLMWLQLATRENARPVVIDSKFKFRRIGGDIQQVTLLADRTLHMLPLTAAQQEMLYPPVVHDGKRRTMVFTLKEPATSEFTLHVQFEVTGITEFGHIRLPHLSTTTGRVTRRWLAISASPAIEVTPSTSDYVVPLDNAEFLNGWGQPDMAPQLTYRLLDAEPMWYIATGPHPPRTAASQLLDVRVDRVSISWVLQARLTTTDGRIFQHRLRVPADVIIESVAVIQDDTRIVAHAFQDQSGVVTVFLDRGVEGQHRLEFRGYQPRTSNKSRFAMPTLSLLGASLIENRINIYRSAEVLVEVRPSSKWTSARAADIGRFHEPFGRMVASYDIAPDGTANKSHTLLVVRRNHPRIDMRLVTTLQRVDDQWEAEALLTTTLDPKVPGVLDKLRFEIPIAWSGPFSVEPSMSYRVHPVPGQRKNHLVLLPDQPVSDRITITIRGPLMMSENERVSTPDIVPLDTATPHRFLVLPTRLNQQRVSWKTRGLQPIAVRDALPTALPEPTHIVAYRIWARYRAWSKPRAVIANVQRVANEKQISLAEVFLGELPGNRFWGTTVFQLEPAGTASCTLTVPEQIELIHVSVDNVPATLIPLPNRRWRVQLGPNQLPQLVAVVFHRPAQSDALQLQSPWIDNFDVEKTLWSVHALHENTWAVQDKRAVPISQLRQTAIRLGRTANLIKSTSETLLDNPLEEVTDWYTPWAIRLATTVAHATRLQKTPRTQESTESETISWTDVEKQQDLIAKRLKVDGVWQDALHATADRPQTEDLFLASCRPADSATGYAFNGAAPYVSTTAQTRRLDIGASRLISAWCVGLMGLALLWLSRRRGIVTRLAEWPQIAGIILGLVWWLFCMGSLLGCVVILLSIHGLARRLLNHGASRGTE